MNTALEYSTRVDQEGGRRCKKSTLNDLVHLTPIRIPLMISPLVFSCICFLFSVAQSGPVSPNQGQARRPMRGSLEEHIDHLNIWGEAGRDCLGKSLV
jgi:hypothetical protein